MPSEAAMKEAREVAHDIFRFFGLAACDPTISHSFGCDEMSERIARALGAARAQERERAAQVAEGYHCALCGADAAAAIRALD